MEPYLERHKYTFRTCVWCLGRAGSASKKTKAIKWKKLISEALSAAEDKKISLKKLKKIVLNKVQGDGRSEDDLVAEMMGRLEGSSKYVVKDKMVSLCGSD